MNPETLVKPGKKQQDALLGLREELRASGEDREVYDLLVAIAAAGITLRCNSGFKERLYVKPKDALTPELIEGIKRHKVTIVRAMQDHEYRKTGIIQSERQVFELTREHFGLNEKEGGAAS